LPVSTGILRQRGTGRARPRHRDSSLQHEVGFYYRLAWPPFCVAAISRVWAL
jgi:hypothetical protein